MSLRHAEERRSRREAGEEFVASLNWIASDEQD
jgi:hypothetical protein